MIILGFVSLTSVSVHFFAYIYTITNEGAATMPNLLTLTTTTDSEGDKSYSLEGEIIDHEGQIFYVGEFCFDPLKIEAAAKHYTTHFQGVTLRRIHETD